MLLLLSIACYRRATLATVESPDDRQARLPLVVAVHGYGSRPDNILKLAESCELPVRIVAPRAPLPAGGGFSWFDIDHGPTEDPSGIARSADRLAELIGELSRERPTLGEPVITGFSQGGILSFAVAVRHPDVVGAAVPMAGGLPASLVPSGAPPADRPTIHAFHGRGDPVVPFGPAESLVQTLAGAGWTVELTPVESDQHTVTDQMRDGFCQALAAATLTAPDRGPDPR